MLGAEDPMHITYEYILLASPGTSKLIPVLHHYFTTLAFDSPAKAKWRTFIVFRTNPSQLP